MAGYFDFYADGGTQNGTAWTNPSNAFNGNVSNYAEYDIPASTGKDTSNYLLTNSFETIDTTGNDINSVMLYIYCDVESGSNNDLYIVPMFNGTPGDEYDVGASTTAGYYYADITEDSQAPATWTYDTLQTLHVKVYGGNTSGSKARWVRVYYIDISVVEKATLKFKSDGSIYSADLSYNIWGSIYRPFGCFVEDAFYYGQLVLPSSPYAVSGLDIQYLDGTTYNLASTVVADASAYTFGDFSTNANSSSSTNTVDRLYVRKFSATQTGKIVYISIYFASSSVGYLKVIVANSSGNILAVSEPHYKSSGTGFYLFHISNIVNISSGNDYYLGYITESGGIGWSYVTGTSLGGYIANSYSSPTDFNPASLSSTSNEYKLGCYVKVPS